MNTNVQKVYIVGGQGSGKTTLAIELAQKLKIPHIDLDTIRQPGKLDTKREIEERLPYIKDIAEQKSWVVEGIYVAWTKELLDKADQVVFLDVSPYITIPRVLIRYIQRTLTGNDKYGFINEMSLVTDILNYHYPKSGYENNNEDRYITRKKTEDALKSYKHKLIVIKKSESINKYLQSFS